MYVHSVLELRSTVIARHQTTPSRAVRARTKQTRTLTKQVILSSCVVLAFAGLLIAALTQGSSGDGNDAEAVPAIDDMATRIEGDPHAMGSTAAPVVLVEYADFRCPFCGVFARDVKPALVKQYVDAGVLRIEWRDLPVFGQESVNAAVAGKAAGAQGRFWEFYDAVFAAAPERGHATLDDAALVEFAKTAGVPDIERFRSDLKNNSLLQQVQTDTQEATAFGANATPTFLVNGEPVLGAQPLSVFQEKIDRLSR